MPLLYWIIQIGLWVPAIVVAVALIGVDATDGSIDWYVYLFTLMWPVGFAIVVGRKFKQMVIERIAWQTESSEAANSNRAIR